MNSTSQILCVVLTVRKRRLYS